MGEVTGWGLIGAAGVGWAAVGTAQAIDGGLGDDTQRFVLALLITATICGALVVGVSRLVRAVNAVNRRVDTAETAFRLGRRHRLDDSRELRLVR